MDEVQPERASGAPQPGRVNEAPQPERADEAPQPSQWPEVAAGGGEAPPPAVLRELR